MLSLIRPAPIGLSLIVAACAIHPLPEDVTGIPTNEIVQKIRCEARSAVRDNLNNARRQNLSDVAIAYNFSFDMTEINNLDPVANLSKTMHRGMFTANASGNFDRTRENIRTFTITDSFVELLTKVKDEDCRGLAEGKNYLYPITGDIGIYEMIDTFIKLTHENLAAPSGGSGPGPSGDAPTLGDKITFTTKFQGSITPKVTLTPVGNALQIADASLGITSTRTDAHQVIVSLAKCPSVPSKPRGAAVTESYRAAVAKRSALVSTLQKKVGTFISAGTALSTSGTNACSKLLALNNIENMILRFEILKGGGAVIPLQ